MNTLARTYGVSLALLTDLYEITMAYGYWKAGRGRLNAAFHLFYRRQPFGGGYTVACGLDTVIEYLERFRFASDDLTYLETLTGADGAPLFEPAFLDELARLRLTCDVDAVPEGTVVFPYQPLVRVRGPIIEAQILETALLNFVNFQTLIATKAARVCQAANGEPVLEFGLRRAQGIDGGLAASRAAFVGGCFATSNLLAGKLYGIPVRGTHAHSWVMSFESEREAFAAYADALPSNCVFLVDTYNTLDGVRHAVEVGRLLRERGHELLGVRLDSGDLAYLSVEARRILDDGGFPDAVIYASNDLDEHVITSLKQQNARIGAWGVGTQLVTAFDQPALGAVYKLTAVREAGRWRPRVKLSEQTAKVTTPGILQVRRFSHRGEFVGDMIYDEEHPPAGEVTMIDPFDLTRRKRFPAGHLSEDLLVPILRTGERVYDRPSLAQTRERVAAQLAGFHEGIRRLVNPHVYPVGLEQELHRMKTDLVLRAREEGGSPPPA